MKKKTTREWSANPEEVNNAYLKGLCEILYRGRGLLASVDSETFKTFSELYSGDASQGLQLLKTCARHLAEVEEHSPENYARVLLTKLNPLAYKPQRGKKHPIFELQEPTKKSLAMFNQLEQTLARWNVHPWIMANQEVIKWFYRRRELYPLILAQFAITPVMIGQNQVVLPYVKVDWLFDLVYPCLWSLNKEKDIATRLSSRTHHSALLNFSAQLNDINLMLQVAPSLIEAKMRETLIFVAANAQFFSGILGDKKVFFPPFVEYMKSNLEVRELNRKFAKTYGEKLRELCQEADIFVILNNPEKFEYYGALLRLLVENVLNKRLPLLVQLARISSQHPQNTKMVLDVATWVEQYREIFTMSFTQESEWNTWIAAQPLHAPIVQAFSDELNQVLAQGADVRPAKRGGEWENFPSAMVCFIDCFTGLEEKERTNDSSCNAKDVRLYQLLLDERNLQLVHCLENHRSVLSPIFELFVQEQSVGIEQLMELSLAAPAAELHPVPQERVGENVSPVIPRRPRNLMAEFDPTDQEVESGRFSIAH